MHAMPTVHDPSRQIINAAASMIGWFGFSRTGIEAGGGGGLGAC
jgi:hypothetical protein